MRALLVEDTADLGAAIAARLRGQGHAVEWLTDGQRASERVQEDAFDLIILDLMLPSMDGSDVLKLLRCLRIHTPVLVITARAEIGDKIDVLDLGADDYLVKPFDLRELEARDPQLRGPVEIVIGTIAGTHARREQAIHERVQGAAVLHGQGA